MARPSLLNRKRKNLKPLRQYTVLRCPMVGHQASWCRGLCEPVAGHGICGRPAPHVMRDQYQRAIARFQTQRRLEAQASTS